MNQTMNISQSEFDELNQRVKRLEQIVKKLLEKEVEPPYGSDEWWEWSDKKALEAIKKGEYKEFSSAKDMVTYLKILSAKK